MTDPDDTQSIFDELQETLLEPLEAAGLVLDAALSEVVAQALGTAIARAFLEGHNSAMRDLRQGGLLIDARPGVARPILEEIGRSVDDRLSPALEEHGDRLSPAAADAVDRLISDATMTAWNAAVTECAAQLIEQGSRVQITPSWSE